MTSKSADDIRVGRIGRAHGLKGEVFVTLWTDAPDERFAVDAVLQGSDRRIWRVRQARWQNSRLVVRFAGIDDRNEAEAARGVTLSVPADTPTLTTDPDEFFDRDLVGLQAAGPNGESWGSVSDVIHLPGHDLLAVRPEDGGTETLVPFVSDIVTEVDVVAGRVVIDPPPGLFESADAS